MEKGESNILYITQCQSYKVSLKYLEQWTSSGAHKTSRGYNKRDDTLKDIDVKIPFLHYPHILTSSVME